MLLTVCPLLHFDVGLPESEHLLDHFLLLLLQTVVHLPELLLGFGWQVGMDVLLVRNPPANDFFDDLPVVLHCYLKFALT